MLHKLCVVVYIIKSASDLLLTNFIILGLTVYKDWKSPVFTIEVIFPSPNVCICCIVRYGEP